MDDKVLSCVNCGSHSCKERDDRFPNFCPTVEFDDERVGVIVDALKTDETLKNIALTSAEVEGQFYGKLSRVEETIEYIKRGGYKNIGIATCIGLINETRTLMKIFDRYGVNSYAVCCKVGGVDKSDIGVPDEHKLNRGKEHETMCNPILQAKVLEERQTDFNIIMGLCVGHDSLFSMHSKAPVTTLVVKDRVLAHNPVAALYTSDTIYSRFK
ncbi:MAG: DUF1847 domain-containing protein [Clostridiales bacterium]|jgi:uncharacterized metal-binding protein|nr:DUF1847 domain-containing protein [Clostridiales bacterium]